ncbi:class I SAM-dependent methyltransferase [Haladaptatus halobius]|uniref:class I SAM-dependent methyltransferase n=1 Tax=Haladaptatus halobius TaxID=2884875 RepID=UPI001D0BBD35|nr:class I SAM-dependent methyltransferase [Haladaptatus halobius]
MFSVKHPLTDAPIDEARIERVFAEVQREFPFGSEYLNGKLGRTKTIISLIAGEYPPGSNVLSIGSGPCDFEAVLSRLGYSITAIDDLNDQWHQLGNNRERIKEFADRVGVDFKAAAAGSTDLPKSHWDVVLALDVIEHISTPREFLNAAVSHLKTGGRLILLTPNGVHLINRIKVAFGRSHQVSADYLYWNVGEFRSHIKEYTPRELRRMLEYHDMRHIETTLINQGVDKTVARSDSRFLPYAAGLYKRVTNLDPNFRDTQVVTAEKPSSWKPINPSTTELRQHYKYLDKYNLDELSDEEMLSVLQNKSE